MVMQNKEKGLVVIKFGGNAMGADDGKFFSDIEKLAKKGYKVLLVHGGGPEITKNLTDNGIASVFDENTGYRITADQKTAKIISDTLTAIGMRTAENIHGAVSVGAGSGVISATKLSVPNAGADLGYVGEVESVNVEKINDMIKVQTKNGNGAVVVISPVAQDKNGDYYNINGDDGALAIAEAMKADKFVLLTNVDGVLKDVRDPASLISSMTPEKAEMLIDEGVISGGMIPKIRACIKGVKNGVKSVYIFKTKDRLYDLVTGKTDVRSSCVSDRKGISRKNTNKLLPIKTNNRAAVKKNCGNSM